MCLSSHFRATGHHSPLLADMLLGLGYELLEMRDEAWAHVLFMVLQRNRTSRACVCKEIYYYKELANAVMEVGKSQDLQG